MDIRLIHKGNSLPAGLGWVEWGQQNQSYNIRSHSEVSVTQDMNYKSPFQVTWTKASQVGSFFLLLQCRLSSFMSIIMEGFITELPELDNNGCTMAKSIFLLLSGRLKTFERPFQAFLTNQTKRKMSLLTPVLPTLLTKICTEGSYQKINYQSKCYG